jgi:hypothetical protein
LIIALCTTAQNDLGNDAVAKQDQDKDTEELGEGLAAVVADSAPEKIGLGLNDIVLRDLVVDKRTVCQPADGLVCLSGTIDAVACCFGQHGGG